MKNILEAIVYLVIFKIINFTQHIARTKLIFLAVLNKTEGLKMKRFIVYKRL